MSTARSVFMVQSRKAAAQAKAKILASTTQRKRKREAIAAAEEVQDDQTDVIPAYASRPCCSFMESSSYFHLRAGD